MRTEALLSPLNQQSTWKNVLPVPDKQNTCDEFLDLYGSENKEEHKLTTMFSVPNMSNQKSDKQSENGFHKIEMCNQETTKHEMPQEFEEMLEKIEISDEDDDDENDNQNENQNGMKGGRRKLNKGLKLLSVIVKDIVEERQSATYKEVADIILRDNIKFEGLHLNSKIEVAREEQNVKRRVYDALNVLISAGVLVKEGKYVRNNPHTDKMIVSEMRLNTNTLRSKIVI